MSLYYNYTDHQITEIKGKKNNTDDNENLFSV